MAVVHALVREPGSWFSDAACGAVGAAARGDSYIFWPEEGAEKVTCPGCAAALATLALEASLEC